MMNFTAGSPLCALKPLQSALRFDVADMSNHPVGVVQYYVTRSPIVCEATLATRAKENSGSIRRKLWDLSPDSVFQVLGTCLRFNEVKKFAAKVGLLDCECADYDLHCQVVKDCLSRNALSELVQRELDNRFVMRLQQVQQIKTTAALAQWWDEACSATDWVAVFWAVLTHPRCSSELETTVLGQVHMLQLQLVASAQAEGKRMAECLAQSHRLTHELAAAQRRLQSQATEHAAAVAALQAECVKLRGHVIRAETERELAQKQSLAKTNIAPVVRPFERLADEYGRLLARNQRLRVRSLRRAQDSAVQPLVDQISLVPASDDTGPALDLQQRSVLCVGGRTQGIPVYREVIETRGAHFTHHDGGEEEKAGRLEHQLQAADLVICQVGCISHSAYWRVKAHCKRTGKPCLFVEMPSRSALERALSQAVSQVEKTMPLGQQLCNA